MVKIEYGKKAFEISASNAAAVSALQKAIQSKVGLHPTRQGLKIKQEPGADPKKAVRLTSGSNTLSSYGVDDNTVLELKDLGPQIGYRTVFVVEYLGPILIMALYASRPAFMYGAGAAAAPWSNVALLGVACWIAHFAKRELETFFVHRFSRPTMPMSNLFKNSIYYWGFAAAVGYPLCHPLYTAPGSETQVLVGAAIMGVAELVNLLVHLQLRGMRPAEGSDARSPPKGALFSLVSCPNYTAEVLSWVGFSIMTQIALSYGFTIVGFLQMAQWAMQKHKGYIRSSDTYKALGRKAIVPFLY